MEVSRDQGRVTVLTDLGQVGEARRLAQTVADSIGLNELAAARAALIATEAATNLVRHGGGGSLFVRSVGGEQPELELIAVDRGPGMENVERCLRDGFSTGGTRGEGLGAIQRQAREFHLWSAPGRGTALMARVHDRDHASRRLEIGFINEALAGHAPSGDAGAVAQDARGATLLLADGLGHGLPAAEAAHEAVRVFAHQVGQPLDQRLQQLHQALAKTRGAAAALCRIDDGATEVRFAGVGNVTGAVVTPDTTHHLISHNGILGHQLGRVSAFTYPLPPRALVVMHSDGISARWDVLDYPGLVLRHPALIAAVIWRDHRRGRDDASVLVARRA